MALHVTKSQRRTGVGRHREFAGVVQGHIRADQLDFIRAEIERTQWSPAQVLRALIDEAIAARQCTGGDAA